MNVLFANYGDFTTNSLNHIGPFADALGAAGHDCIITVPAAATHLLETKPGAVRRTTFCQILRDEVRFADGRPADIIHAWTPRDGVRRFVLLLQRRWHARLVVHLEDNEDQLFCLRTGIALDDLARTGEDVLHQRTDDAVANPRLARQFLRTADGVTYIIEALREFVPPGVPGLLLYPGISPDLFRSAPADTGLRAELGIGPDEKLLVFPGSSSFANETELRELYEAVGLLNDRGIRARLVRTGHDSDTFLKTVPEHLRTRVIHLGFVDRAMIPRLLSIADVLVQPGHPSPFNDYRLPSKIPEFLTAGKPVIVPATNIGLLLRNRADALVMPAGGAQNIADACATIFADPDLARTLAENSIGFARRNFDLTRQAAKLINFYTKLLAGPLRAGSTGSINSFETHVTLSLKQLAHKLERTPGAEEAAVHAGELIPLVEHLERPDTSRVEREHAERERDEWRTHFGNARAHLSHVEKGLQAAQAHGKNLAATLDARTEELGRVAFERDALRVIVSQLEDNVGRLARETDELRAVIVQREERNARIENSFSWRITMPLRWLRRTFIDPRRKSRLRASTTHPVSSAAPGRQATAADITHESTTAAIPITVDEPRRWTLPPRRVLVRGWCFHPDGRKLTLARAIIDGRVVDGIYGYKRMDVAASFRDIPQAEYCGWRMEVDFRIGDRSLEILMCDDRGLWIQSFKTSIRVTEDASNEDLSSFEQWSRVYDTLSEDTLRSQTDQSSAFAHRPLFSIILPVYNTPEKWLLRAIDSVKKQTYENWELCIANDASTAPHVRPILDSVAAADARIRVVHREQNGHISAASNSALALATGDFIGLLDHDDELAPNALFEVARAINKNETVDCLYSDEDKIDEDGRRFEPYFKPDWNPDLFFGQNYISHFTVYRAPLVREAGGFREGFEGSQDWDLALRVIDRSKPDRIVHIPRVLYHWRAIPGSTALQINEKSYPAEAARRALVDHFQRINLPVTLEPVAGNYWRVIHPLPAERPLVSLIIPTRNNLTLIKRCVESIQKTTSYSNYEILIVDNHSDDPGTLQWFAGVSRSGVQVLPFPHPFNYSAINNHGVRQARGSIVGLLNNDIEAINPGWLDEMVSHSIRPDIGCVGAMLYYPNNLIQHAGVILGVGGVAGHAFRDFPRGAEGAFSRARLVQNYSAVTAACLVVRKDTYEKVGGLDEEELGVAFNDIDFCLKVRRAGYRNLWTPFAEFYHHESASRGADDTPQKAERFEREVETMLRRWGPELSADPNYNPNLTLEKNDFSFAIPPRHTVPGRLI